MNGVVGDKEFDVGNVCGGSFWGLMINAVLMVTTNRFICRNYIPLLSVRWWVDPAVSQTK